MAGLTDSEDAVLGGLRIYYLIHCLLEVLASALLAHSSVVLHGLSHLSQLLLRSVQIDAPRIELICSGAGNAERMSFNAYSYAFWHFYLGKDMSRISWSPDLIV